MTEWHELPAGKRLTLFYALFLVILGLITIFLFILDGIDYHIREAMVILIAALLGNLLYDVARKAFDVRNKEDYEKVEVDERMREERLQNIERIVNQWDREKE